MYNVYSRPGRSYFSGLMVLFGGILVGMFIGSMISMGIWVMATDRGIFELQTQMTNPAYRSVFQWIQVVSTFFVFFVPAWFMAQYMSRKPFAFLGYNTYFSGRQYLLTVLVMLAALPVVGAMGDLNKMIPLSGELAERFREMERQYNDQVKVLADIRTPVDYVVSLLLMALAPAIFEEMLFRGGMQQLLFRGTKRMWVAILLTSIVFSAIHLSFFGFLPRLLLGVVLGLLFHWSGSLWLPILGHFVNNAVAVTQLYWYLRQGKTLEQAMEESLPIWWAVLGIAALIGLLIRFYGQSLVDRKERVPAEDQANEEQWMS
jgi:membrane protease YdiL (CAAX protease family)